MQTLRVIGATPQQRIFWMSLFVPGINGRRGLPYVFTGNPGTGKTSVLGQITRMAGFKYEPMLGSLRAPSDFLGGPFLQRMKMRTQDADFNEVIEDVPYMHYAPPGFALRMAQAGRALINFDELNTCPVSVQNAMLRVLFEGVVGDFQLPPSVRMCGAMNPIEQAAGGRNISMPLQNRYGQIEWPDPSVDDFMRFMLGGASVGGAYNATTGETSTAAIDPEIEERSVDALWGGAFSKAIGEIGGFLKARPQFLLKLPTMPGKPWPSLRTNEMFTCALAGSYVYALSDQERMLACAAFIGDGAYKEFHTWRRDADLPDPADLLDGGAHFEHSPARLDRTAAVLAACTALVTPENAPKRKERAEAFWKILKDVPDSCLDVALGPVSAMSGAKLSAYSATAFKVLARFEPLMQAMGVIKE